MSWKGKDMKELYTYEQVSQAFDELFPLCRSILGQGYRDSLKLLQQYMPMEEEDFLSGEKVLNWTVPKEWVIREAWIKDEQENVIVDFKVNNLHVLNYSEAVDSIMDLEELKKYIYTSNSDENAIPYTFSYYKKCWGFCMSKAQLEQLKPGKYHAYIDSEFIDGRLVVGHTTLPGESEKEILLTSYLCHPSMANNELSGPLVLAMLYQRIKKWKNRKYTYRFVVNPETIGSICYLSRYGERLKEAVETGLVLTCLGGTESLRYKRSRQDKAPFDMMVRAVNAEKNGSFRVMCYLPSEGSDERQYCSPGFNLPIGQMARKSYGSYKEYHTSLDTKELMGIDSIIDSCNQLEDFLLRYDREGDCILASYMDRAEKGLVDADWKRNIFSQAKDGELFYQNLYPYGEVKLGDYDLYPSINSDGAKNDGRLELINQPWFIQCVMVILNYSDGQHSLEFVARFLNRDVEQLKQLAQFLIDKGLLKQVPVESEGGDTE